MSAEVDILDLAVGFKEDTEMNLGGLKAFIRRVINSMDRSQHDGPQESSDLQGRGQNHSYWSQRMEGFMPCD